MYLLPSLLLVASSPLAFSAAAPPSSPYAPTTRKCPKNLDVRAASEGLSSDEQAWRKLRLAEVASSLKSYLSTANIPDFDVDTYLSKIDASNAPVAGMAISGGGSQSGMGGLGLWQAFDDRYKPAVKAGTGGLTQCLSYLSGLSGGGLNTVIPLASNNFSSLSDLRSTVDLTSNYLTGKSGSTNKYYKGLFEDTYAKFSKGFPVSSTDILGMYFRQYLNPSLAYGDVSDFAGSDQAFAKGLAPMPIVSLTEVIPGSSPEIKKIMYPDITDPTTYEETPFEFGNWLGGRVQAFFPTKFLGSAMSKGKPANSDKCVNGFDKITFAQGSTGNAFNFWFIDAFYDIPLFWKRDIPIPKKAAKEDAQVQLVEEVAKTFKQSLNNSIWARYPNPFNNYNGPMQGVDELLVVDGSENSETIPLRPLIIPARKMDFVIAFDSSGEEVGNNWVNGTTFGQSAKHAEALGVPWPKVPDATTFVNLGLNQYPTFFGCNDSSDTPLVLYVPNAPWSAYSNYSYTQASFTNDQLDVVFENSLNIASYGQGKVDVGKGVPPFPACIACGLIYRSLERAGQDVPDACQACMQRHCWNGTVADTPSEPTYNPEMLLKPGVNYKKWNSTVWK